MELADRPCEAFDPPSQRAKLRAQVLQAQPLEGHVAQFVAGAEELGRSLGNTGLDPHYVRALLSEEEATQLNVDDTFLQLGDFAENLQHQVQSLVVEPLREYGANLAEARRQAAPKQTAHDKLPFRLIMEDSPGQMWSPNGFVNVVKHPKQRRPRPVDDEDYM